MLGSLDVLRTILTGSWAMRLLLDQERKAVARGNKMFPPRPRQLCPPKRGGTACRIENGQWLAALDLYEGTGGLEKRGKGVRCGLGLS